MQNVSPPQKGISRLGRVAYLLLAMLSVVMLCRALSIGQSSWVHLLPPPSQIEELLPTSSNSLDVMVRTENGVIYGASFNQTISSQGMEAWKELDGNSTLIETSLFPPCHLNELPASHFFTKPSGLIQCTRFIVEADDLNSYSYMALDEEGQLWQWVSDEFTLYLGVICLPIWGLILVFFFMILWLPSLRDHLRRLLKEPRSQSKTEVTD